MSISPKYISYIIVFAWGLLLFALQLSNLINPSFACILVAVAVLLLIIFGPYHIKQYLDPSSLIFYSAVVAFLAAGIALAGIAWQNLARHHLRPLHMNG